MKNDRTLPAKDHEARSIERRTLRYFRETRDAMAEAKERGIPSASVVAVARHLSNRRETVDKAADDAAAQTKTVAGHFVAKGQDPARHYQTPAEIRAAYAERTAKAWLESRQGQPQTYSEKEAAALKRDADRKSGTTESPMHHFKGRSRSR